ncbi:16S rRNA (adenine(1518)-N(6)/adenine(1519)-N(6))-dimethyltransferase RsmA [Treponema sp. OttesenSCG-928-L16]|nr:16S rRNA (adenine(1518)-N(6)/adenine(1519)-N(6))-dimethyltransferase RsmA [Treponema sp. OttesenSCG-928-L16]
MDLLINYDSPVSLRAFLDGRDMGMQKKFGQNFLINPSARERLLDALAFSPGEHIWEIGPGLGAMTSGLLERGGIVRAFEIDRGFIEALKELFRDNERLFVVEGDVLKTWPLETEAAPYLLGNLPYNIGAVLLADFIEKRRYFRRMVVTVQRETAQRMTASPGSKDYSSFTVLCSSVYKVRPLMVLKGSSFYPEPKVDSQGVCFDLKENIASYPSCFYPLVRALFSSRRKTIKNNLQRFLYSPVFASMEDGAEKKTNIPSGAAEEVLASCALSVNERAEKLDLAAFTALAGKVEEYLGHRR